MSEQMSTDNLARTLWNYLQLQEQPVKSDVIFCLCSHDTRVAERAAQLMLDGYGSYLVFSGGVGKLTNGMFATSEAETFAGIAQAMGVDKSKIVVEDRSTNTGENIRFTFKTLQSKHIQAARLLLVQKPYMERRTYATFKKQWPDKQAIISVTSPQLSYEEYVNNGTIPKDHIINVMVGDMQRIREYPKQGFQIAQNIPAQVWEAYKELVARGFDKHLIQ